MPNEKNHEVVPTQPENSNKNTVHIDNTPGTLILQWLTYAFWGWTLVALYWLIGMSLRYFIGNNEQGSSSYSYGVSSAVAYPLAAVIVLGVISFICDAAYSRREPANKSGAATVIMVIHAVIFALAGIGSLIVAVFSVISMLLATGDDSNASLIFFIAAIIMTILYGATLLRTLRPTKFSTVSRLYKVLMAIVIIVTALVSVAGPVAYAQKTRSDRAVEAGLPEIARGINTYANQKKKLPASLKDIDLRNSASSARSLLNDKKVSYTALERIKSRTLYKSYSQIGDDNNPVYHYKLCVNYAGDTSNKDYYDGSSSSRYRITPSTYAHKSGKVCYDLQTDY